MFHPRLSNRRVALIRGRLNSKRADLRVALVRKARLDAVMQILRDLEPLIIHLTPNQ
jgi:hypothetical protein